MLQGCGKDTFSALSRRLFGGAAGRTAEEVERRYKELTDAALKAALAAMAQ